MQLILSPSCATGPVNGPSIAIDAVHFLLAAALDHALAALLVVLLLLLLPQPAAISPASAIAAKTIRPFIAVAPPLDLLPVVALIGGRPVWVIRGRR